MSFPKPYLKATFLKRRQRFLVDVRLEDGSFTTVYCANPGSLHGCLEQGNEALLWDSQDSKRKRRYTWRAVRLGKVWVGTDTHLANRIAEWALKQDHIFPLENYHSFSSEKTVAEGHKIDFFLEGTDGNCFLEIKSATVVEGGVARFPDSITPRGLKHLQFLTQKSLEGHKAAQLFVVQRGDATSFRVNDLCHPAYNIAYKAAMAAGVEMLALSVDVSLEGFSNPRLIPVSNI